MIRRKFCAVTASSILTSRGIQAAEKAGYQVLASDRGQVALIGVDGKPVWKRPIRAEVHDITLLGSGGVLLPVARDKVAEWNNEGKEIWSYKSERVTGNNAHVEIHAVERLPDGNTLVAESGNRRLVEVDREGKIVRSIALKVEKPNPHRDTRLARKTADGTYLVCHEGDGKVREYDSKGEVVWTHTLDLAGRPRSNGHGPEGHGTEVYGAFRTPKGTTLIAAGNGNRVYEVDRSGKTVWSLEQKELPGIVLAWVTTLHILPNGNIIVGNCHAGPENPQLFEVTRDKKVVWNFKDFGTFGNAMAAAHVIGLPDGTIR
jgi:WD40 repeat protein